MLIRSLVQAIARQLMSLETKPRRNPRNSIASTGEFLETRSLLSAGVLTYHNDNQSTGVNPTETQLTPSTVNMNQFQKTNSFLVDGVINAQPLYVQGLNVTTGPSPGIHNTTIVATEHDSIYAIDTLTGQMLWSISLTDRTNPLLNPLNATGLTAVPSQGLIPGPDVGITATPVIDGSTNTMYVEGETLAFVPGESPNYLQMLYKIDIASGHVLASTIIGDTIVAGSTFTYRTVDTGTGTDPFVLGTGDGAITVNSESRVYFNALTTLDQSALVLMNGHVVVTFAGYPHVDPVHGWMLMFDENSLTLQGALNTTPNGSAAGISQSGAGPAVDSQGNLYVVTGSGTFDSDDNVAMTSNGFQGLGDYGDAVLKIGIDPTSTEDNQNGNLNGWGLAITDYFSPFDNAALLNSSNLNLGTGAATILPNSVGSAAHPHLLVAAGEQGTIYLIDRDNMGKFDPATDHVVQSVASGINGASGPPAFFNGQLYYFPFLGGPGEAFGLSNATIGSPVQTPDTIASTSGAPSISANGNANGIVWVIDRGSDQLNAYSAANLNTELWTSNQAPNNRDSLLSTVEATVPTVGGGQVIVATANQVVIYGPPIIPVTGTPTLSNIESTPLNYIENGTKSITNSIQVSETGGTMISQATVQITGNYQPFQDQLLFHNTQQLNGFFDVNSGTLTIRGNATPAQYQAALQSVTYHNTQDNPNPLVRTVTFQASAGQPSNSVSRYIVITPVNDPPVITVDSGPLNYVRLSTTPISPGLLVADPDNQTLPSATVQITGNYQPNEDRLIFTNTAKITGTWDASTGTLTLTGADTVSNYRTALRSVSFYDTEAVPVIYTRTVSFQTTDGMLPSNVATRFIRIIQQNNAPLLSSIETTPLSYTQNAPATNITSTLLLSDPDNATLPSATVQITGNYQPTADVLSFVNTAKITGTWDAFSGTLTLAGVDTVSNYRTALRSVQFFASNVVPGNLTRTISFQATDGTANSNIVTRNIAVHGVPNLSGIETTPLSYTVANGSKQVTASLKVQVYDQGLVTSATVQIFNVQAGDILTATTIPGILSTWNATTGTLTFTGASSAANYQTVLQSVKYNNPSQNPSSLDRHITFQVFEGALASNQVTRNINYASPNDQPQLSAVETTTLTYFSKSSPIQISATINVFDPDQPMLTGAVIQIVGNYLTGQDVLKFVNTPTITGTWTPATGRMYLKGTDTVANYQAALRSVAFVNVANVVSPGVRTISFQVSDGLATDPNTYDSNVVTRKINVVQQG